MTDINKLAARLRELSNAAADGRWSEFSMRVPAEPERDADLVLQTAASELQRLDSALREHIRLTREAVEQCDVLRAQLREIESAPVPEPAADYETLLRQFRATVAANQRFVQFLTDRIAELERQPIRWRPIGEAPKDWSVNVLLWSDYYQIAFLGGWSKTPGAEWVDLSGDPIQGATHFAEIVGPEGEALEREP